MFLFSCKKEHNSSANPSGKKYLVTFNVSNFLPQQGNFALKHNVTNLASSDTLTNLKGYLDVLYCFIYDPRHSGWPPTIIMQDSTMSNMGTITDSLYEGNYSVIVIAGKKGLSYSGVLEKPHDTEWGYGGKWQDAFRGQGTFTVSNSPVNQVITLNRMVGKLEVQVLDHFPNNAKNLNVTINKEASVQELTDLPPIGDTIVTFSKVLPITAFLPAGNFTMDELIGNRYFPFSVTITCTDAANNIIASKVVNNVTILPNTKTILAGKLFTNAETIVIKADTAWSNTPTTINFSLRKH